MTATRKCSRQRRSTALQTRSSVPPSSLLIPQAASGPPNGPGHPAAGRVLGGDRGAGSGISGPGAGGCVRPPLTRRSAGGAVLAGAGFPAPAAADGSVPHGRAPPPPAARSAAPVAPGPPPAATSGHGAEPPGGQGGAGRPGRPTDPRADGPQCRHLPPALRRLGGAGPAGAPARAPPRPPPPARPHPPRASDARPCPRPSAAERGDGGGTGPGRGVRNRSGSS